MARGILIASVVPILAAVAAWPQDVLAQYEECPPATPPAVKIDPPRFIAWGRSGELRLETSSNENAILNASAPVLVSVSRQAPSGYNPLSLALGLAVPVRMPQRAAILRVTVTWVQVLGPDFRAQCGIESDLAIRGGFGKLPAGLRLSTPGGSVARITVGSAGVPCSEMARVPLTVHIASPRQAGFVRAADVCGTSRRRVAFRTWSLRQEGRQRLLFRAANVGTRGREVFTYRALAGRRLVGSGSFVVVRNRFGRPRISRPSGR